MKSQFIIIPFIHNQPSLNIQLPLSIQFGPGEPTQIRQSNLEITSTYKYEIRIHVLALPPLALPLEQVAAGEDAGESIRTCTVNPSDIHELAHNFALTI